MVVTQFPGMLPYTVLEFIMREPIISIIALTISRYGYIFSSDIITITKDSWIALV